jgi:hypothetical protein
MKTPVLTAFALAAIVLAAAPAHADWRSARGAWDGGEWNNEYRDGPCRVKEESKRDEYKREVKCKDGYGALRGGEYKREFRNGPCKVKIEAKHDEYKEEVKCG